MKLIFAQGNPGAEYARSRHNIGWQILDALAAAHSARFQAKQKFFSDVAEINLSGKKILLAKPQTFYNQTGRAARALADFYKIAPEEILVIHDDLAINFGRLRIRQNGSDGGNNGLKSLNAHLPHNYWRLRVGILNKTRSLVPDADFVLSFFSQPEQELLNKFIIPGAVEKVIDFINNDAKVTSLNLIPTDQANMTASQPPNQA